MSAALRGAGWGWLVGCGLGLIEAAIHTQAEPGWSGAVWLVGALTDGAIGAGLGALWAGRRARPAPAGAGLAAAIAAALTLGAGAAGSSFGPLGVSQSAAQPEAVPPLDVLWILVSGVPATALDTPEVAPQMAELRAHSLWWARTWAPSEDPSVALASVLTGREPPGHGAAPGGALPTDVPTIAEAAARSKLPTRAVLQADPSFTRGFVETIRPAPPRVLGLDPASARVLLWRAVDALVGPKGVTRFAARPSDVLDAVRPWLEADGPLGLTVVHLPGPSAPIPADDPDPVATWRAQVAETDAAVVALLQLLTSTGRADRTAVVLTGVTGHAVEPPPSSDAADTLRPAALWVPWMVRLPSGPEDARVLHQLGTWEAGPSLLTLLDALPTETWDGTPQIRRGASMVQREGAGPRRALSTPFPQMTEAEAAAAAAPPRTPMAVPPAGEESSRPPGAPAPGQPIVLDPNKVDVCDVFVPDFGAATLVARRDPAEGEPAWVVRAGGYALHLEGADLPSATTPWRMFDLKHDPDELGRPVSREAITCGGTVAADRAQAMITALQAAVERSASGKGRALPPPPKDEPARQGRGSNPDPDAPSLQGRAPGTP
jgi:hypothetical protein